MCKQWVMTAKNDYKELDDFFLENEVKRVFLVCGQSIEHMNIGVYFENLQKRKGVEVIRFSDFAPNPQYNSVVNGVRIFNREGCDLIAAVGGGSAIDVAKCIKLYSNMNENQIYLQQQIIPNAIKFLAVPTTAGTGSEATKFAVIYYNGEKQSVSDNSCIPHAVMFDPSALRTLPEYHRKSTMMDALCHAVESFWSINSTEESQEYSRKAIHMIFKYKDLYLDNDEEGNLKMLLAANMAGKAINIAQTTAGHAMAYKLTGLYGISHGHAVALCVSQLWSYMISHMEYCVDPRGETYIYEMFDSLAAAMDCPDMKSSRDKFACIVDELGFRPPLMNTDKEFDVLKTSVNPVRLRNNPIGLDPEVIDRLYCEILEVN